MATITKIDRRTVLWLALGYAGLSTGILVGLVLSRSEAEAAYEIAFVRQIVNFGGYLSRLAQWFLLGSPDDISHWRELTLYVVGEFAGTFMQGIGYAVLGLAFLRIWRQSKGRAVASAVALAAVLGASYKVGTVFYERAQCVSTVEHSGDGTETFTECGASIFGSGLMWMTVVFAIVVIVVVLREARSRRSEESAL